MRSAPQYAVRRWLRRHRTGSIVLAVVLVAAGGFLVYRTLFAVSGAGEAVEYVTEPAATGTLVVSVSGTGNAALGTEYAVTPTVSGTVTGITVQVGDQVTEGQTLFLLDNPQLDMNVVSAEAQYDQAVAGVYNAQANVTQSEQSLDQLENGTGTTSEGSGYPTTPTTAPPTTSPPWTAPPTSAPPTTAPPTTTPPTTAPPTTESPTTTSTDDGTTSTEPTDTNCATASADEVAKTPVVKPVTLAAVDTSVAAAATSTATTVSVSALASSTASDADIEAAEDRLAAAERSLSAAEANVTVAEFNLEQAKEDAAARTVTAPADGVITTISVQESVALGSGGSIDSTGGGSQTGTATGGSSSAAMTIMDPDSISVVVALGEVDIPQIEVDQKATLIFDALPDLTLTGKVTQVDLVGTNTQGVVTYDVTVAPDTADPSLRAGMTASAAIITNVRQDVLLVPSGAVKSSSDGGSRVQVLVDGAPEDRTVEVGLSDDTSTEVVSGLQSGEEVVTQTIDPNSTNATTNPGDQGGFGGGDPGGPGFLDIGP